MNTAELIAFGALAVAALGPVISATVSGARRDGKIDAAIEQLTAITTDHETRLRRGKL